jgi:hypothetical protein
MILDKYFENKEIVIIISKVKILYLMGEFFIIAEL